MKLNYKVNSDATIQDAMFTGCTGLERVSNVKEALGILRIENPAIEFVKTLNNGKFHGMSDEEYDRLFDTVKFISELFRYPDDPPDAKLHPQMNALTLLANAITEIVRLELAVQWYQEHEEE